MKEKPRSFTVTWGKNSIEISNWIVYLLYFLISLIAYGMFLQKHYSIDSYGNSPILTTTGILGAGRFGFYLVNILFNNINFNLVEQQSIFTFMFILTITFIFSSLFLKLVRVSTVKNLFSVIIIFVGVGLTLINVYTLEWLLFPEVMLIYSLALVLSYFAARIFFKKPGIPFFFLASLLLLCAITFYQGVLPAFVTWSFLLNIFSWKSDMTKKKRIGNLLYPTFIGVFTSFLSFLASALYQNLATNPVVDRAQFRGPSQIWDSFRQILGSQKHIYFNASGFLPPFSLLLFLFVTLFAWILSKSSTKDFLNIFLCIGMVVVIWGATFFPHLFLGAVWLSPRTITGVFFLVAFLFLVLSHWINELSYQKVLAALGVFFLGLNIFQIQFIGVNHYKSNRLDEEYAYLIEQEITRYQAESGNTITKIAVIRDAQPLQGYSGVHYSMYEINMRSYFATWADVGTLNYYTGNTYEKIEWTNSELEFEIVGRNWDTFVPSEQLFFEGDTLYWVIY